MRQNTVTLKGPLLTLTLLAAGLAPHRAALAANPQATGSVLFEYGIAEPQSDLHNLIDSGNVYRLKIFGGAKLKSRFLSAVGLGLDFSFAYFDASKLGGNSYYQRYQWDMFQIPLELGWFVITPGLSWVVTHTTMEPYGLINETSVRPAFLFDVGLRIPVLRHFNLCADGRYEYVLPNRATSYLSNESVNLTGSFVSLMGGAELYF